MSRDPEGNYSLPTGVNPVVDDSAITVTWWTVTTDDIGDALTNSLDRDGKGGMLAPFKNADGTVGAPGATWADETDSGWYRAGTKDIRASINGVDCTKHKDDTATAAGEQNPFELWDGSAFFAPLTADSGQTPAFTSLGCEDLTVSAGGLTVTTGGATAATATFTGAVTVTGDVGITGAYNIAYQPDATDFAWAIIDGTTILAGEGVASVAAAGGAGNYNITLSEEFNNSAYPVVVATPLDNSGISYSCVVDDVDADTFNLQFYQTDTAVETAPDAFIIYVYTGGNVSP